MSLEDGYIPPEQDIPEDYDDELACDCCDGEGCPNCLPCGGMFAPGSEECDFCKWNEECSKEAHS